MMSHRVSCAATERKDYDSRMLEIEKYEAEQAKGRQIRKPLNSVMALMPQQNGSARDKAAAIVGVSPRYVQPCTKRD